MNRHSSDKFRDLAVAGTILLTEVGSRLHGTQIEGTDDMDRMGICVEPCEYVTGLKHFEQYIYRTQPEGVRSGHGDLDLCIYGLRKYMNLALNGNPTVLLPLFAPDDAVIQMDIPGHQLRSNTDKIISKHAGGRFLGYLRSQHARMSGAHDSHKANRPELIEAFGWDTKVGGHAVRLGLQGVELMRTGSLTLPMSNVERKLVQAIRRGGFSKEAVLTMIAELDADLVATIEDSDMRPEPDREWADRFMHKTYVSAWGRT